MKNLSALIILFFIFVSCNQDTSDSYVEDGYVSLTFDESSVSVTLTVINSINEANYNISGTCNQDASVTGSIGGINFTLDCTSGTFNEVVDLSSLPNGNYNFNFVFTELTLGTEVSISRSIMKDNIAAVQSISQSNDGNNLIGDTLNFNLIFSSRATVTGIPKIVLDIDGNLVDANYVSGSGSNNLIFSFTLVAGYDDLDGIEISSNSIDLSGGSISVAAVAAGLDISAIKPDTSGVLTWGTTPTVSITFSPNITKANEASYMISGSCSYSGQNVNLEFDLLSLSVPCIAGVWTSGNVDVSGEADNTSFPITADLANPVGYDAIQAIVLVDKTTAIPVVTISNAETITAANVSDYSVTGTCSENDRVVTVDIEGLIFSPNCSGGAWTTGSIDVSALADSPTIDITADHDNSLLVPATQAVVQVVKDLSIPTVSINSAPSISGVNQTNYALSGNCSENTRTVTIDIGGLPFTTACSGTTWYKGSLDVSSLPESGAITITADHDNALLMAATQASVTISKATTTPSVNSLGVVATLTTTADLTWVLVDTGGYGVDDYIINYRTKGSPTWLTFNDGISTDKYTTITGLSESTTYEFRVSAIYNTSSQSAWSNIVEDTTKTDNIIFGVNKAMNVGGADSSRVVAFEDDTDVTLTRAGVTTSLTTLNKGEDHTFASQQYDIIDADKPIFTAGRLGPNSSGTAGANMVWTPSTWAGKEFNFNTYRADPQVLEIYPIESGSITVKSGNTTIVPATNLTAGVGTTLSWNGTDSYQINSTAMVLIFHYSAAGGYTDPKPIIPAALQILGFSTSTARLTTGQDGTNYTLTHSNSVTTNTDIDKIDFTIITSQGTAALYQGESILITADKKISAASYADSNGGAAAPFMPTSFMKKAYVVNASSDYVAFASTEEGDIYAVDETDTVVDVLFLVRSGGNPSAPYRARVGATSAGTRFYSTVPMAGWYQPNEYNGAMRSDETILYGTNLDGNFIGYPTPANPITCQTLIMASPTLLSGVYTIDPDGDGGSAPFDAYCDMVTQGGGWTLVIRYDRDLASAGDFSLPVGAGRSAINITDLNSISATANLAASQDIRPFIAGGAEHFMHVTTASGDTNYTHTYFSEIYRTVKVHPDNLFDISLDTDSGDGLDGTAEAWSDTYKNRWFESDFSIMTNSETTGAVGSASSALISGEGTGMFTNGDREGALYSSGISTGGTAVGHTNPKVNWGFRGKDGTQQTYGGATHVGTYCNSTLLATTCMPTSRMNLMFVR